MTHHGETLWSGSGAARFLEFELEAFVMAEVEQLAIAQKVTPFEMCVILLQEKVAGDFQKVPVKKFPPQLRRH